MKADSDDIDRFELDTSVEALVADINKNQGFKIIGWFKPAFDDDGVALEHQKLHVCSLEPAKRLTNDQLAKLFNGGDASEGVSASTTVAAPVTSAN